MFLPPHRGIEGVWASAVPVRDGEAFFPVCTSVSQGHSVQRTDTPVRPYGYTERFFVHSERFPLGHSEPFPSVILCASEESLGSMFYFCRSVVHIGQHLREILRAKPSE